MLTSTKNYTKMDSQNHRTNGKCKAIQTKSHTKTYTFRKRKREKIYISLIPNSTSSIWDDSLCIQVFHRFSAHQDDCGDILHSPLGCWENFPFLFFVWTALGVHLGFAPASECWSSEGVCSPPREDGVKGAGDSGGLAHSAWGEGGVWNVG